MKKMVKYQYLSYPRRSLFELIRRGWSILKRKLAGATKNNHSSSDTEGTKRYEVSLPPDDLLSNLNRPQKSVILQQCEGTRGHLYIKKPKTPFAPPYAIGKKTEILEVNKHSMKVLIHETKVVSRLVYIDNIFGFLKEVD